MPTYVSLFSSAGVGCYGFKQAGFDCVATNELLPNRLAVQKANEKCRYQTGYICGDITQAETKEKLMAEINKWRTQQNMPRVDVVFATPPCQGMSTANYKKTDKEQIRNSLVVHAIRIISEIKPKIFVFENVRSFMKTICTDICGDDMTIKESIYKNLSTDYNIEYKIINFKDYGVPSSRPRTIVIGTSKELHNISPLNLFPTRCNEMTLRNVIGDMPSLQFGMKDPNDFLHFARRFPEYQIQWIQNLDEGQSAFENSRNNLPYKVNAQGKKVLLRGAYMGNKYRRLIWDRPCSCVTTRNDQLASQDTIHPSDNRVLSIRELMRVMTIPDSFKWTENDAQITLSNSDKYLHDNELNIRRCIGEAVPTHVVNDIAKKIKLLLQYEDFVQQYNAESLDWYCEQECLRNNFYIDTYLKEQKLENAKETGSFYTPQCVVYDTIKNVKIEKTHIRILEPSVGLGAFIPQIAQLFSDKELVEIDVVELEQTTILSLRESLQNIDLGSNVRINFIHSDFLTYPIQCRYDLVVTNPPYNKSSKCYSDIVPKELKIKNLFALFLWKIYDCADEIACVIPKNFLMADEFAPLRNKYMGTNIVSICDFGVDYLKKVFVEIISIHFSKKYVGDLIVTDYVNNARYTHAQKYIYHDKLWVIYRNAFFDNYIQTLKLDVFTSFRDRQITNSKVANSGRYWIIRSKNIQDDGTLIHIEGYDKFIDDITPYSVRKFLNSSAILMPNFTYNTRASILPDMSLPNGSVAVLIPKCKEKINAKTLSLYATPEFREYYAIVKSRSRFTLNIDDSSVYYIGLKK